VRITWLTTRHPPDAGGMATSSGRLVDGLRDRGHEVLVVHLSPERPDAPLASPERTLVAGANAPAEPERLFWHLRARMEGSVLVGFGGDLAGYLAVLWGRFLGSRSAVLFRGNDFEKGLHDPRRAHAVTFVLDRADLVGTVSTEMAARARSLRAGPVLYTPNGIPLADWAVFESDRQAAAGWRAANVPPGRPVVGILGQLKQKKGLDTALALFGTFGFGARAHLLTVGDVADADRARLAATCGPAWSEVPFQPREALLRWYLACDAVLIPSFYDGMPNVLLEAMALGRTIVASRAGAMPDVVTDGVEGLLFDAEDPADAARALARALGMDDAARGAMGARARARIERDHTAAAEAERLESALTGLAAR
jgi:glycosyltransferase involved in cell wall biosynthesis